MGMMPIPQNYKKNIDWILKSYTDAGVSFPNGFQKDAIQNAVGARKTNKWKDWHCDISCITNPHGIFIVVEDSGTVGLTGRNISGNIVNEMMARDEKLPPDERLARFTSLFNSGGNTVGAGLYGAGKGVYSIASENYLYYFDSLREDGKYVANVNNCGQVMEFALEGDDAATYIFENTGMPRKTTVGTRIIIVSPKEELVSAIQNGELVSLIQESWWLIIQRLTDGSSISVNGEPVLIPDNIKNAKYIFELQHPEQYSVGYKVKHFGLYVFEDGSNRWSGISYYRKGMKIGHIDIKDIPKKVEGKFWGYVEVDEPWEEALSEIEDSVHFGISKGKKNSIAYQYMKIYCYNKFHANMVEWGFIKDKESEDKKLKDELKSIAEELQNLFDRLKFEDLGKGPKKPDFDVRLQDVKYPVADSFRVTSGDNITFAVRINSTYASDKQFKLSLYVLNPENGSVISKIEKDKITVRSNTVYKASFIHNINTNNSLQFAENRIVISVKAIGSGKEKTKILPYFYDIDKPENPRETVSLTLHECLFPVQGSRRVNFGESIRNVCWRIENKRNHALNYKLNVSVHNASNKTFPKIVDIGSFTGIIQPFEDAITSYIDEIVFERNIYEQHLSSGVLELRARLIANEDDPLYEKGDKITFYNFKIFLNEDEKNGKRDSFDVETVNAPDKFERAWRVPGNGRKIIINSGHAAYLNLSDYPEIQKQYLTEQMMKQYVLLYLDEGKYDLFGTEFKDAEPQEAVEQVLQKIESVYYESLK